MSDDATLEEIMQDIPTKHKAYLEYQRLLNDSARLEALFVGGVDNWDGYDWAMEAANLIY